MLMITEVTAGNLPESGRTEKSVAKMALLAKCLQETAGDGILKLKLKIKSKAYKFL